MKISYDKRADAMYIRVKDARIKQTKKIRSNFYIDLNSKGEVRGIEILNASQWFSGSEPSVEIGRQKVRIPALT